ncbi:TPR-like protein [Wilcoxina mikolae CBS 423.85]|nr:TPR-like protein [Wilcoxina mikolae CBS 423.85]
MVKEWFCETDLDWLLIFDNTEKVEDISDYWPSAVKGSILLTSQNPNWIGQDEVDEAIRVNTLSDQDGARFMQHLLRKTGNVTFEEESAIALVSEVGGHPLAIRQMASYVSTTNLTLSNLLKLYRESAMEDHVWAQSVGKTYRFTVATVWKVSYDKLDPYARFLLGVIALMNPEKIPEKLFSGAGDVQSALFKSLSEYIAAVDNLQKYSLIWRDGVEETLEIHRLVRKFALRCLEGSSDLQSTVDYAVSALRRVYPKRSPLAKPLTGHWMECDRFISHLASLMDELVARKDGVQIPSTMVDLLLDGALYLWERDLLAQGRKMTTAAKDICERLPEERLLLSDVYNYHACILHDWGELEEAGKLFSEQVAIRKDHLNSLRRQRLPITIVDEIQLANAYNNVAGIYLSQEKYSESIIHHHLSIALKQRWPIQDVSLPLGLSYGNLANVYGQQEEWDKAEYLYNKALAMDYQGFPLKKALTLHNFGRMRVAKGLPKSALHLLTKALSLRNSVLGDHYDTTNTLHIMSTCYRMIGNNNKAIGLLREAIRMMENSESDQLRIARSKYALGLVLEKEGIAMAYDLKQEAIKCGMEATENCGQEYTDCWSGEEDLEDVFDALVAYI